MSAGTIGHRDVRTSETHPLQVHWVPDAAHGTPGRLGLTLAPGKVGESQLYGYRWQRDLEADLHRLRTDFGCDRLVSLMEGWERTKYGIADLLDRARAHGIATHDFPIVDCSAPRAGQAGEVRALVDEIRAALARGERVVVHCRGGIGRSGLIAALALGSYGLAPAAAIDQVRSARPGAVETSEQRRYVADTLAAWRPRP